MDQVQINRLQILKNLYRNHGAQTSIFNLFGIRNAEKQKEDIWNDWIGYFTDTEIHFYRGTTDPGIYWTLNPMNPKGTSHLCLGYHKRIWTIDKHQGKYTALCNNWKCYRQKVWRDLDEDTMEGPNDMIDIGWFGVNLHRADALQIITSIGKYSAGCQVIVNPESFNQLLYKALESKLYWFDYFLFDKSQISFFGELA
jgi:hypothetical protein